jgi:hypothetical protein
MTRRALSGPMVALLVLMVLVVVAVGCVLASTVAP